MITSLIDSIKFCGASKNEGLLGQIIYSEPFLFKCGGYDFKWTTVCEVNS